jgi:microcystin degradation protein MlrC
MRVFVGSMLHESNTFAGLRTSLEDFRPMYGWDVLRAPPSHGDEAAAGILATLSERGVEVVPSVFAHALPSGIVTREAYEHLRDRLLGDLERALPVAGVCLALHGAMYTESTDDPEGEVLERVRELVGPATPITCALDMHGNVTPRMVHAVNAICAYRTAPHVDKRETGERAARLLLHQLDSGQRLTTRLVRLPLVVSGEQSETDAEPMISILEAASALERSGAVVSLDAFIGYAWADSPHVAAAVVAVSDAETPHLAQEAAEQLAAGIWEQRHAFGFTTPAIELEDLPAFLREPSARPTIVADAGDNPTAGASENLTLLLQAFLDAGVASALFAVIADPEAFERCRAARAGAAVSLELGNAVPPPGWRPLPLTVTVRSIDEERGAAVVAIGDVAVVVTREREAVVDPTELERLGLDLGAFDYLVLKSGYVSPEFQRLTDRVVLALTPGETEPHLTRLPYVRLLRPAYPLDPDTAWSPGSAKP